MNIHLGDTVLYKGGFKKIVGIESMLAPTTEPTIYLIEDDAGDFIELLESDIVRVISVGDKVQMLDPDDLSSYSVESINYDTGRCILVRYTNILDIMPHTGLGN
jgi:hypothetical protein